MAKNERARKIARIHCLAKDCGMSNIILHITVEGVTGKDSIASLTDMELEKVEKTLVKLLPKQKRTRTSRAQGPVYLSTPEQRDKVTQLIIELTPHIDLRSSEAYLNALSKRMFKRSYNRLLLRQMQQLIEALKSIIDREQGRKIS